MSVEFRYQATGAAGQMVNGRLPAASEAEAVRLLQQQGLTPTLLELDAAVGAGKRARASA